MTEPICCPLTPRQLQALGLVARGMLLKQAAREMGISEQTLKNHMWHIHRRLGTHTQAHAVYIALTNGWIE